MWLTGLHLLALVAFASAGTVEVLHDNWGVPHIYASDNAAMAYGYGYATAEDHGELCLSLYAGARCRAAQYYGGPLDGLVKSLTDRFLLSFGARRLGESSYAGASDFSRSLFVSVLSGSARSALLPGVRPLTRCRAGRVRCGLQRVCADTPREVLRRGLGGAR